MIAGEDDDGVVVLADRLERLENAADVCVHVVDDGVVGGEFLADVLFGSGPGQESFVPAVKVSMVERVSRQKVLGQADLRGIVLALVSGRNHQRIVGGREVDVQKERFLRSAL